MILTYIPIIFCILDCIHSVSQVRFFFLNDSILEILLFVYFIFINKYNNLDNLLKVR